MELLSCPSCGLPRNASEADRPCAVCGRRFSDGPPDLEAETMLVEAPIDAALSPVHTEPGTARNWILVSVTLLLGVGVLMAMLWEPWANEPEPAVVVLQPQSPEKPSPVEPALSGPEIAPAPREHVPTIAVVSPPPPEPPAPELAPAPRLWVSNTAVAVIRLDRPEDVFILPRVGERNHVRLVGRVKKLTVDGVDGGATLDASALVTKDVSFSGKIDDGATVRVRCDGGTVSFRHKVDGASQVTILAESGFVSFANPTENGKDGSKIAGGSRVWIAAKSVAFVGAIHGSDTQVNVTISTGGSLRFLALSGAAKLHYRQSDVTAPPPRITPGAVTGKAECKSVVEFFAQLRNLSADGEN